MYAMYMTYLLLLLVAIAGVQGFTPTTTTRLSTTPLVGACNRNNHVINHHNSCKRQSTLHTSSPSHLARSFIRNLHTTDELDSITSSVSDKAAAMWPPLVTAMVLMTASFPTLAFAASESASTISIAKPAIDVFVSTLTFFFLCRTVLSWYPKTDLKKFPFNVIAWPTEPLLQPVRDLVPPAFGVDVSSIVWIMLLSFSREVLTGQQGILTLLERG